MNILPKWKCVALGQAFSCLDEVESPAALYDELSAATDDESAREILDANGVCVWEAFEHKSLSWVVENMLDLACVLQAADNSGATLQDRVVAVVGEIETALREVGCEPVSDELGCSSSHVTELMINMVDIIAKQQKALSHD